MLTLFNSHFQCSRILRSPTRWCSATNATFVFTRSDHYLNIKPWLRPSHVPCQACYGITNIPSGPWLCRTCTLEIKPPCELCPNKVKIFAAVKKYVQKAHPVWKIFIVLKKYFRYISRTLCLQGGAMKSTRTGHKWAHVSCALWIPEVSIGDVEKMEPITKISCIPVSENAQKYF